ncbi:MAG: TIGR02450 family Trp-rich protein [Thermostichus sp. HHBFW_bins_43]
MARSKPRHKQRFPHLLGSKWTSVRPVMGWRHFQVKERQQGGGGLVFAELRAVCDPQVRIWVNASTLKNRALWQAGWTPLTPLEDGIPCGPKDSDTNNTPSTLTEEPESRADWPGI